MLTLIGKIIELIFIIIASWLLGLLDIFTAYKNAKRDIEDFSKKERDRSFVEIFREKDKKKRNKLIFDHTFYNMFNNTLVSSLLAIFMVLITNINIIESFKIAYLTYGSAHIVGIISNLIAFKSHKKKHENRNIKT